MPSQPTAVLDPTANALQWSGRMILARSSGRQLNTQATLLHGKVQAVELALRTAAQNGGILNINHRVPFDDLARRSPGAILALAPLVPQDQAQYDGYAKYFGSKVRAGVVRLDEIDALYLIPPCAEADRLLVAFQAAGVPLLPKHCLLVVIAAMPGPLGRAAAASASRAVASSVRHMADSRSVVENAVNATGVVNAECATESDMGKHRCFEKVLPVGNRDGQEMSQEALLNLFSNPELLRSLQHVEPTN